MFIAHWQKPASMIRKNKCRMDLEAQLQVEQGQSDKQEQHQEAKGCLGAKQ